MDWLLDKYLKEAAGTVEGRVEHHFMRPFSVETMDAGFNFSTVAFKSISEFLLNSEIVVDTIRIFTAFVSELNRSSTKMETETELFIVRSEDGKRHALLFLGSRIYDPLRSKNGTDTATG